MSSRRLLFDYHQELDRLETIKGELQDRYDQAVASTGNVAMAQLAMALANIVRAQAALYEAMTREWPQDAMAASLAHPARLSGQ